MTDDGPGGERPLFADLFPTTILTCALPDHAALNRELLDHVQALRAADRGRVRSNQLGWQSRNLDASVPAVRRFLTLVLDRCRYYGQGLGWAQGEGMELAATECWANVNPRFAYNQTHHHPNSLISGAYYVQVPAGTCGDLLLLDPRPRPWVLQPLWRPEGPISPQTQRLPPEEGRLVLFPSWLDHGVAQNLTDGERVSLSFNVDLRSANSVSGGRG